MIISVLYTYTLTNRVYKNLTQPANHLVNIVLHYSHVRIFDTQLLFVLFIEPPLFIKNAIYEKKSLFWFFEMNCDERKRKPPRIADMDLLETPYYLWPRQLDQQGEQVDENFSLLPYVENFLRSNVSPPPYSTLRIQCCSDDEEMFEDDESMAVDVYQNCEGEFEDQCSEVDQLLND